MDGWFSITKGLHMRLHKPDVRMVAVGDLIVDEEYQREAIAAHVAGIAKNFDEEAFGVIVAGERDDGSLHPVDGFQRLNAAMERGVSHVPCQIITSRGAEHEAELFGKLNKRRGLSTHQLFKADVCAGKPDAVAVYEAITEAGLNVRGMKPNGRRQSIGGVKQCQTAYRRMGGGETGEAHVTEVLKTLRLIWGQEHHETAYHCGVIGGLAFFLRRFGDNVDRKRLRKIMEGNSPIRLMGNGDTFKMMSGTTRDEGVARAFFEVYNKNLTAHRLDWDESRVDIAVEAVA
jgi:hypothetical protein